MKKITKIGVTVIGVLSAAAQIPGVNDAVLALVKAHPHSVIAALGIVLWKALTHDPNPKGQTA